ncbi:MULTISPECIES: TspO/MBR family protein [Enterococcus]|uniref:Sensory protein n=1 Tax=Enterococcus alcedinis TaxID=1274384 RepID=A0A917N566_9ENTE|nr:TspO/MBR family protein [Enterococcus alcedinis]MBP2102188.1 tryptophan-rich sensory protein [Enterococcus alcedinis]GGI65749.1 sensory protein [Enterococcus alcedinis]
MTHIKDKRLWFSMIGIVALGSLSGLTMNNPKEYYLSLTLPSFAPPSWLFGPVWIVLYLMLGIALYTIWIQTHLKNRSLLLTLFTVQLIANLLWSFLFFNQKNILAALIDITILFLVLSLLQGFLFSANRVTFFLLLPYYAWITFATVLTYSIYFLN